MLTILMSVYNGRRYLGPQLDSLQAQSRQDWQLFIRDDASSDDSLAYLRERAQDDRRIRVWAGESRLGARDSFSALLGQALSENAQQLFWCDQDDFWHPDKLARMQAALEGARGPCLVHCDLRVVDAEGSVLSPSLLDHCRLRRPTRRAERTLLVQNFISGCGSGFNRAAADLIHPIPPEALMHDHWAALVVSWSGEIRYLPQALLDYRQHAHNLIGVGTTGQRARTFLRRLPASYFEKVEQVGQNLAQARALLQRLQASPRLEPLERFARLDEQGLVERYRRFLSLRIPWCRPLGLWAWLATLAAVPRSRAGDRRSDPRGNTGESAAPAGSAPAAGRPGQIS